VQVLYLSELLQDVLEYAAAQATGLDRFKLVETGLGPAADREQWDDTGNLLVLAPGWWRLTSATWPPTPGWRNAASR
jgi:arginine deiminase